MTVPFSQEVQLNNQLGFTNTGASGSRSLFRIDNPSCHCLPGQPWILIQSGNFYQHLEREFLTPDLNTLAPHLWLVATQSSSHIDALHEQVLKGCNIVITENPELHLTWANNRVFVKPIPPYMLSNAFWTAQLVPSTSSSSIHDLRCEPPTALVEAALGFMRTYYYLIRHESDLHVAKQSRLLPASLTDITLEQWHACITGFGDIQDDQVSPRYSSYGTFRLSRLNLWAKFLLRRFQFYHINRQYGKYFARFYAPILFFFAILTVVLGAMQVSLQADVYEDRGRHHWVGLQEISLWFSVATLMCICAIGLVLLSLLIYMLLREISFAVKGVIRRRRYGAQAQVARKESLA